MKNTFHLIFLITIIFTSACQVEKVDSSLQPFFDVKDFLEKEMANISQIKSIKKRVTINGKVDEQTLDVFDLNKDLEIFKNSNINNIAWLDKYEVDSTLNSSNQLTELKYTALEKKLKTKELVVKFSEGEVEFLKIKNASSNQVSNLEQNLEYLSGKGYTVESIQKVTLSEKQNLKIEVEFLN